MFFNVLRRSGRRRRREQGLFYASLVTAVVAFYTLLTFKDMDVLRFLKTLESGAVNNLLSIIPILFGVSIFFLYTLVHLAYKYQLDSRQREIGLYLVMGMRRRNLFAMLSLEALWNGAVSFLIGLPLALLLTEGISLFTAVRSGLGLSTHRIMLNPEAMLMTGAAFFLMQIPAIAWFAGKYILREPAVLLATDVQVSQRKKAGSTLYFLLGIGLLGLAYYSGMVGLAYGSGMYMLFFWLLIISGISGSFFVFRGIGGLISRRVSAQRSQAVGLQLFTGRQLQENAVRDHRSLALSSIFLLLAIAFGSFGISTAFETSPLDTTKPMMDITFKSISLTEDEIKKVYETEIKDDIAFLEPMYLESWIENEDKLDLSALYVDEAPRLMKQIIDEEWSTALVQASSFNKLRVANGLEPYEVTRDRWAVYTQLMNAEAVAKLSEIIKKNDPVLKWDGKDVHLLPEVNTQPLTVDGQVTLSFGFIVPDDLYAAMVETKEPHFWNLKLTKEALARDSELSVYTRVHEVLSKTYSPSDFGNYLGGIGRSLFYKVASAFLTLYLGVLFFLLANTLLSTKFLMEQRRILYRYETLRKLGANLKTIENSVTRQTLAYFLPVLGIAYLSSVPAVITLFNTLSRTGDELGIKGDDVIVLGVVFLLMLIFELIYTALVRRTALRTLREELGKQRRTI